MTLLAQVFEAETGLNQSRSGIYNAKRGSCRQNDHIDKHRDKFTLRLP